MTTRTLTDIQDAVHSLAVEKGWWPDKSPAVATKTIPEKLCLIHSEVSEALEAYRIGDMGIRYAESGKPEGFDVELADTVIRILDLCGALGIDLEHAIERKHFYNTTRPYRHGGKAA